MEETLEQMPGQDAPGTEDSVLRYLAERHPDDEEALTEMTALLAEGTGSTRLLETLYGGLRADRRVEDADRAGYLRGRNEAVEMERRAAVEGLPADDGGQPDTADLPLLRHIRRSVWD